MTPIRAPSLPDAQAEAWLALFDVHDRIDEHWALVGGQMVQSHCWERGASPSRATIDVDAALDIRARPHMLREFTVVLAALGFAPDGESFEGHQHRWVRGSAQIDVLIPRFLGERASRRRGARGGTTIEAPGAQGALDRARPVDVAIGRRVGSVLRPTLQGALVSKAAAVDQIIGESNARHLSDIATLASLVTRRDDIAADLTATERRRMLSALALVERDPAISARAGVDHGAVAAVRASIA